jgi:hypothetical protein
MKKPTRWIRLLLASALALFLLGQTSAGAQELPFPVGVVPKARLAPPSAEELAQGKRVAGFGTSIPSVEQVPGIAFQESGQTLIWYEEFFREAAGGTGTFVAPIHLPSGVIIDFIAFAVCGSPTAQMTLGLWDLSGQTTYTLVGQVQSTADTTCQYLYSVPLNYAYPTNEGHFLLLTVQQVGAGPRFRGAEVGYRRRVSPAPSTPTFTDVPSDHMFYQFIEALFASGITAGCKASPAMFCPNNPITRGEMAVFLAKALGLNWPL